MATETWSSAAASELRAEVARQQSSASQVASAADMDRSTVARKLNGSRAITLDEFAAMSRALAIDPSEMFDRTRNALIDRAIA